MYQDFGLFIDGAWRKGQAEAEVISPVTEKPLGRVPMATAAETLAAMEIGDTEAVGLIRRTHISLCLRRMALAMAQEAE